MWEPVTCKYERGAEIHNLLELFPQPKSGSANVAKNVSHMHVKSGYLQQSQCVGVYD